MKNSLVEVAVVVAGVVKAEVNISYPSLVQTTGEVGMLVYLLQV